MTTTYRSSDGEVTVEQLDMFAEENELRAKADEWVRLNPKAWSLIVRWAINDADRGRRCSMAFYVELLRRPEYHSVTPYPVYGSDGEKYKIPNELRAPLARKLVDTYPKLDGCFLLKESKADV